ncbi:FAD-dependent oxidoreductase [Rhizobium sp. SG570]|uniref:FAD-dependent oxidoreductase n=1 Tax=Rhizobium sp. SG570 TaxID=2587113 RepID=UPI001444F047|nr:FAD-dependent oxidoreductase [Rhizobium sp. SG570]NKJ39354.1 2-polyprenyl-6-methoxyphenol hydroxylase-like FAD-dependent oxidoreductase [Rhizobium sp. SG570]
MSTKIIDVLIVGAGPTGTTLAIDLARRGLDIRIIDKAITSFPGSRAKGLQPRTLEVLQDLGAIDEVMAGGSDYPLLGFHLGPLTIPWRMIARKPRQPDIPFPSTWLIPQFRTDAALHARLAAFGHSVEFGSELTGLAQDARSATARVSALGETREIAARYIVGADGGGSAVRQNLGLGFEGSTHEDDRMIIVDAVTSGLPRNRWHIWPGRAGRFIGACPLPHGELFQWMIRLPPDEKPELDLAAINRRVQARIGTPRVVLHDIQWKSVFRPNIRLAEHYRRGRVFLAGDAAHVHPPAGAQGLNTGIQDAYNLGWKLGQVLAGADEGLLDSYEQERRPIAAAALSLSTKKYEGIAKLDPSSVRRGKDERQLALSYRDGPLAQDPAARTARLQAGDRAPDAELVTPDGRPSRLHEAFVGPHFTAIAYGDNAAIALEDLVWPVVGAGLQRILVEVSHPRYAQESFTDPARTFRLAYGVAEDTVFLIRPDGYVSQIAPPAARTRLQAAVALLTPSSRSFASDPTGYAGRAP